MTIKTLSKRICQSTGCALSVCVCVYEQWVKMETNQYKWWGEVAYHSGGKQVQYLS